MVCCATVSTPFSGAAASPVSHRWRCAPRSTRTPSGTARLRRPSGSLMWYAQRTTRPGPTGAWPTSDKATGSGGPAGRLRGERRASSAWFAMSLKKIRRKTAELAPSPSVDRAWAYPAAIAARSEANPSIPGAVATMWYSVTSLLPWKQDTSTRACPDVAGKWMRSMRAVMVRSSRQRDFEKGDQGFAVGLGHTQEQVRGHPPLFAEVAQDSLLQGAGASVVQKVGAPETISCKPIPHSCVVRHSPPRASHCSRRPGRGPSHAARGPGAGGCSGQPACAWACRRAARRSRGPCAGSACVAVGFRE